MLYVQGLCAYEYRECNRLSGSYDNCERYAGVGKQALVLSYSACLFLLTQRTLDHRES